LFDDINISSVNEALEYCWSGVVNDWTLNKRTL